MRNYICLAEQLRANEVIKIVRFATLLSWSCVVKRYAMRTELLVELITEEESETRAASFLLSRCQDLDHVIRARSIRFTLSLLSD